MAMTATSMVSETDPKDSFPLMPDSKCSGGAYYYVPGTSHGAESWTPSHTKHHGNSLHSFHPYRQPPCFQEIHTFDSQLGRPDHDNQSEVPDSKTDDVFLKYMDGLSPTSCRYVVHYKEAVRERQRMRLFTTYWELEETNRLAHSPYVSPSLSRHRHSRQHPGQPHASGSAPQPSHLFPPANVSINRDRHDAHSQHWYFDPSTNPYAGVAMMPTPSPWRILSRPQVQIPERLFSYGQLPANHQFYEQFSSWNAGIQTPGDDIPLLPPFPPSHDELTLDTPYPSSNPTHDPFNLEVPMYTSPPDVTDPVPAPNVPSHIVFELLRYPPPYLNAFVSEFTKPVLSEGGDTLLPPDVEDEPRREPMADTPTPKEGRKGKCGAKHVARPHLLYDEKNKVHGHIVKYAKREITKHALNVSLLLDEVDRVMLIKEKLKQAAIKFMDAHGAEWALYNSGTLYMTLSELCKSIMQTCRKYACNLALDGFGLRLSIWSEGSELEHQQTTIAYLLDDEIFPPNFVMGQGTDGQRHFLENQVVLNVILDTVRELKLIQYLENLDSLACVAAVAVRCALGRIRDRISPNINDVEFSVAAFKDLYAKLLNLIKEVIMKCPVLKKRWENYKRLIKARLTQ
ncbi:hypothetical protein DFH29DRAFT_1005450 [Suillus ampliporus]|nr:hypothetical protein DFH29DRAFT_1005450 [Suillus ampliporus]